MDIGIHRVVRVTSRLSLLSPHRMVRRLTIVAKDDYNDGAKEDIVAEITLFGDTIEDLIVHEVSDA